MVSSFFTTRNRIYAPQSICRSKRTGTRIYHAIVGTGGAIADGTAHTTATRSITGTGGATADSTAPTTEIRSIIGTGGATANGTADTAKAITITGSGGTLANGAALTASMHTITGSGGARGNGTALFANKHVLAGTGGARGDGAAGVISKHVLTGSGGVVADGTNPPPTSSTTSCGQCPAGSPLRWKVTFTGMTGGNASLNGTWILLPINPCIWKASAGATSWQLQVTPTVCLLQGLNTGNAVNYQIAFSSWACFAANTLPFFSQVGTGNHDTNATVNPY